MIHFYNHLAPWSGHEQRRKVFEDYARQSGFDALLPDNWHKESYDKIMAFKVRNSNPINE